MEEIISFFWFDAAVLRQGEQAEILFLLDYIPKKLVFFAFLQN